MGMLEAHNWGCHKSLSGSANDRKESFPDTGQRSVNLRAGVLDDLAPPRHFGLDQVAERFRRVRREIDALRDEAFLHVRQLQNARDFAVPLHDDRTPRAAGCPAG